ncbi:MAG: HAD family phosphatase, partial [Pseudomonadota bacterium]
MKHIVFDIGAVLIDWDPFLSFEDAFDSRAECEAFLKRVNFDRLNVAGDAGATFAQMAEMVE